MFHVFGIVHLLVVNDQINGLYAAVLVNTLKLHV